MSTKPGDVSMGCSVPSAPDYARFHVGKKEMAFRFFEISWVSVCPKCGLGLSGRPAGSHSDDECVVVQVLHS